MMDELRLLAVTVKDWSRNRRYVSSGGAWSSFNLAGAKVRYPKKPIKCREETRIGRCDDGMASIARAR